MKLDVVSKAIEEAVATGWRDAYKSIETLLSGAEQVSNPVEYVRRIVQSESERLEKRVADLQAVAHE